MLPEQTNEEIIALVQQLGWLVGGGPVTLKAILTATSLKQYEILQRFGSVNNLLEAAGLPPLALSHRLPATAEKLIELVKLLAEKHGHNLNCLQFSRETGIARSAIRAHFGSWSNLRMAAGLTARAKVTARFTHADLMEDLAQVYERHGQLRAYLHYHHGGKICSATFINRYGSWTNTKAEFEKYRRRKKRKKTKA